MNRDLLEMPFNPDQIKHRQGNFGQTLAYLEAHAVIQRLNDALDSDWSFEIVRHDVFDDEVIVLGKLSTGSITKTQFGNSTITRHKTTGEIISIGDDLKAAATDALKKAATLLGVGNYLYSGNQGGHVPLSIPGPSPIQDKSASPPPTPRPQPLKPVPNNTNRISSKQLGYIQSLAKDRAITRQELDQITLQRYQAKLEFITSYEASRLIEELLSQHQERRQIV